MASCAMERTTVPTVDCPTIALESVGRTTDASKSWLHRKMKWCNGFDPTMRNRRSIDGFPRESCVVRYRTATQLSYSVPMAQTGFVASRSRDQLRIFSMLPPSADWPYSTIASI